MRLSDFYTPELADFITPWESKVVRAATRNKTRRQHTVYFCVSGCDYLPGVFPLARLPPAPPSPRLWSRLLVKKLPPKKPDSPSSPPTPLCPPTWLHRLCSQGQWTRLRRSPSTTVLHLSMIKVHTTTHTLKPRGRIEDTRYDCETIVAVATIKEIHHFLLIKLMSIVSVCQSGSTSYCFFLCHLDSFSWSDFKPAAQRFYPGGL